MSLHSRQTNITPNDYFFLLANASTLNAGNINANIITANHAKIGDISANNISTGSLVADFVSTNFLAVSSIETANIVKAFEFSSVYTYQDVGTISSLYTEHIILDQATLDVVNGNSLLLNGIPIATTQDLSTIQDWAVYPAVSTLYMVGNNINGAGNITCQNIYNALAIQTDTMSALTSLTTPSATGTNLRFQNISTTNLVASNANIPVGIMNSLSTGSLLVGGNAYISGSNWSAYPATQAVSMNQNPLNGGSNFAINSSNLVITASNSFSNVCSDYNLTADEGINIASVANINMTAQNGTYGAVNITANGGFNNGINGVVNITANGSQVGGVGQGGSINLTANTPLGFSNLTSKIALNASGINSYAGVIPSFASLFGYNYVYGSVGVNIIGGGVPSILPNFPGTTYIYGLAGVEIPSDIYALDIQPYWDGISATNGDLNIHGRTYNLGTTNVYVNLSNVKNINFQSNINTSMSNCDLIAMSSNGNITTSNLGASNATITTLSNTNLVGTGAVSGYTSVSATNGTFTTLSNTNIVGSGSGQILNYQNVSTLALHLSSINDFTSFGSKSIRVQGDVAQIQLSNNNPAGSGTILNLLSRVDKSEIQSFNSNFTTPLPLFLNASYTSTTALYASTINGQKLPYPYGSFSVNANQTIGVANTAVSTIFDTTEYANGISIVGGTGDKIAVSTSGIYRWIASPQFNTSSGGNNPVSFWFQKNGVNIPRSASKASVANNATLFSAVEIYEQMNAQDTLSFCFTSSDTNMNLSYFPASGVVPANPALILNGNKVADA